MLACIAQRATRHQPPLGGDLPDAALVRLEIFVAGAGSAARHLSAQDVRLGVDENGGALSKRLEGQQRQALGPRWNHRRQRPGQSVRLVAVRDHAQGPDSWTLYLSGSGACDHAPLRPPRTAPTPATRFGPL